MGQPTLNSPAVLVTGVSSGIGLAIAERLLKAGYCVIGSVRRLTDAESLSGAWPDTFVPVVMDVADARSVAHAALEVKTFLRGQSLKALVNNAGVSFNGPLMYQPLDEVRQVFEVNVFGLLKVTQTFLPLLGVGEPAQAGPIGRVVNIGSVSGAITVPFLGAYSASKHAVEALSQAFRRELAPWGVEVVSIEPGFIQSSMHQKASDRLHTNAYAGTPYASLWARFGLFMQANEATAKSPDLVTQAVLRAIEGQKPRTRQPLDMLWYLGRVLPDRWFDKVLLKAFRFDRLLG